MYKRRVTGGEADGLRLKKKEKPKFVANDDRRQLVPQSLYQVQ